MVDTSSPLEFHEIGNKDYLIATNSKGFILYKTESGEEPKVIINCDYLLGGAYLCQPYRLTSFFFYVCKEHPNELRIWNHRDGEVVAIREFSFPIVDLKVREDWVVVGTNKKVMVFNFDSSNGIMKELDSQD